MNEQEPKVVGKQELWEDLPCGRGKITRYYDESGRWTGRQDYTVYVTKPPLMGTESGELK